MSASLYLFIKSLHVTLAVTSVLFFAWRWCRAMQDGPAVGSPTMRKLPHVLDSLLLMAGVALMVSTSQWPHQTPWLAAKLTALLAYIGLGMLAMRPTLPFWIRSVAASLALVVFLYMLGAAHRHSMLSWFSSFS